MRAYQIENQVVDWLRDVLSNPSLDENYEMNEDVVQKTQLRFERVKELYIAGEIDREVYTFEKDKCEQVIAPLSKNGSNAIITFVKNMRTQLSAWQSLTPIQKKRLLQNSAEAVFIQGSVLVGVQPTSALLPLTQMENRMRMCSSGPDGERNRGA